MRGCWAHGDVGRSCKQLTRFRALAFSSGWPQSVKLQVLWSLYITEFATDLSMLATIHRVMTIAISACHAHTLSLSLSLSLSLCLSLSLLFLFSLSLFVYIYQALLLL